ncbi:MAG: hypothetical protein PHD43_15890 [Methylococcales bacterium]|nr:hypothetical protein [Methylococcales bacterium]
MSNIPVNNKLTAPHAGKESSLHPLIAGKTRRRLQYEPSPSEQDILWTAEWWGLHRSAVFAKLDTAKQHAAILACNRTLMNEAYFIEKSGLAYTAKMVLMAESTDVAQLYALIGADEATHLAWIEPFIDPVDKTHPRGQFLILLSELIEECNPQMLVYLVQVILEGWGLNHYRLLAEGCQNPALTEAFRAILKDEALHHHSGVMLHDTSTFCSADHTLLTDSLKRYAEMVRVGSIAAIAALDQTLGGLSISDTEEIMAALGHPNESARKLTLLRDLMRKPGMESTVDKLTEAGYFTPLPLAEAAQFYLENR